jgi:hypothetical protein
MAEKFELNPDTKFTTTLNEVRALIAKEVAPLEAAAFERGRQKGIAEASAGVPQTKPAGSLDPVAMAKEAGKLQAEAAKNGEPISNAAAVRLVYERAGLPLQ